MNLSPSKHLLKVEEKMHFRSKKMQADHRRHRRRMGE
ncbi:hypothetical protein GBAR_LOCUS9775 [Geodia barretti]|uniref:Uncharacterized protein n=1 Tax=Geodia barretti TaxID=519541 RepID=A0AA35RT38_GEOBA|nr:hypothetical protein GBAR_LOCUS9775 [Geodia barretti]